MVTNAEKATVAAAAAKAKQSATQLPTAKVEAPAAKIERAGGKVTVCCRVPMGLRLRLFRFEEAQEPVLGGGMRTFQRAVQLSKGNDDRPYEVVVHGPSIPLGSPTPPQYLIVGGYALTPDVDEEFFTAWMEQNKNTDLVRNKVIFCQKHEQDAQAQSREQAGVKSGMEPMDMTMTTRGGRNVVSDKRVPRPMSTALDPLQTIDRASAG